MKKKYYWTIGILILVIVVIGFIFAWNYRLENVLQLDDLKYCETDEDCIIEAIRCDKECSPCPCIDYGCVNKDIIFDLYCPIPTGVECPPAPPWVTNCKCIDFKCVDCRGDECKT